MVAQRRAAERGQDAVAPLLALLRDQKAPPHARWHAIWTLDAIDGGQAVGTAIVQTLADRNADPSVRRQAARQLGTRRVTAAAPALVTALADGDPSVRFHAATALGRVGDAAVIPAILDALSDERDFFAQYALFTAANRIGRADPKAWPAVVDGFEHASRDVREKTAYAVRETYDAALVEALAKFVADVNEPADARARAVAALAPLYRTPKPWDGKWWHTQPVLSPPPAKEVEWAGTQPVAAALAAGAKDADRAVRLAAIQGVQVAPDPAMGELLANLFRSTGSDPELRSAILRALTVARPEAAAGFVLDILKDPAPNAALVPDAIAIAEKIGDDRMRGALVGVLSEDRKAPADAVVLAADALGRMKHAGAVPALAQSAKRADARVAVASANALSHIGGDAAIAGLVAALTDARPEVRKAAAGGLATLASPAAIEPLLKTYQDKDSQVACEAILALSATPDLRALDAYLDGLSSPDATVRGHAHSAVATLSGPARPLIEKKLEAAALPAQVVDELQKIYASPQPVGQWTLVGPFTDPTATEPFDVAHPPASGEFTGAKGPAQWKQVTAGGNGAVNLAKLFEPNEKVVTYAIARVTSAGEREAELIAGSDDTMTLWVNGRMLIEDKANSTWRPDEQRVKVPLRAGENVVVAKVGNAGGGWQFSVALDGDRTGRLFQVDTTKLDPALYARFAADHPGDPARGKATFFNVNGVACVKCHKATAGGEGGDVGPSLAGVGGKYDRAQLIESVLYPSKQIFDGYQQTLVRTKAGKLIAGSVRGETEADLTLLDANGVKSVVKKADIKQRKLSDLSLMPEGLHASLKPEEFADLIAYLQSLKESPPGK
jgi:putative heme-binding domain-containing protein